MRPLFPQWLRDDIQIVATTLAMDEQVPPDVLAATGASTTRANARTDRGCHWILPHESMPADLMAIAHVRRLLLELGMEEAP